MAAPVSGPASSGVTAPLTRRDPGCQSINWDRHDSEGDRVVRGVYLVRLESAGRTRIVAPAGVVCYLRAEIAVPHTSSALRTAETSRLWREACAWAPALMEQ